MTLDRLSVALGAFLLAMTFSLARAADEAKPDERPGPLPRGTAKKEQGHAPREAAAAKNKKAESAPMSRAPAPATGSMPKGPAPSGKLGTEPTARGKLGTDPKPDESSKPPPRLN